MSLKRPQTFTLKEIFNFFQQDMISRLELTIVRVHPNDIDIMYRLPGLFVRPEASGYGENKLCTEAAHLVYFFCISVFKHNLAITGHMRAARQSLP